MARGRALVVAAAQSSATGQVTGRAVAVTAATAALMPTTCLCVTTLLLAPVADNSRMTCDECCIVGVVGATVAS